MLSMSQLEALAGWALYHMDSDPEAFQELKSSIDELLPQLPKQVAAESGVPSPRLRPEPRPRHKIDQAVIRMARRAMEDLPPPTIVIPPDVPIRRPTCEGKDHDMDITTQRCKFCNATYFDIYARQPELM